MMRKVVTKSIISFALLVLVTASFAGNETSQDTGIYVAVLAGAAFSHSNDENFFDNYPPGDRFLGPVITGAVGYQFNSYFATEFNASYAYPRGYSGAYLFRDYKNIVAVNFMLRGILPLKGELSLFAQVGVGRKYLTIKGVDPTAGKVNPAASSLLQFPLGLGVSYNLSPSIGFIALFQYAANGLSGNDGASQVFGSSEYVSTFSLGFNYYL